MEVNKKNHISDAIDKMSFVNYLPLLIRATADNDHPVPGYLFREIENISLHPEPNCQLLADYLAQRLDKPSTSVKIKVLKIMNHLVQKGPGNFRQHLRKRDNHIKMAMNYNEIPHPLTGTSAVESVRKLSQELLQVLFDAQLMTLDESSKLQLIASSNIQNLGGLGNSNASGGKYEGFGSSPMQTEDTFTDKMLNAIERWATSTSQTDLLIQEALSSPHGNYEPVVLDLQIPDYKIVKYSKKSAIKRRVHIPGKAGGGWDDTMPSSTLVEEESVLSENSSEQGTSALESVLSERGVSNDTNTSPELALVENFCSTGQFPCTLADIRTTGRRCMQLNVKEIVHAIVHVLDAYMIEDDKNEENTCEGQPIKAMLLLEWLLHTDAMHSSAVADICCPSLSRIASRNSVKYQHSKSSPLHAKAEKLLLILQKLKLLPT